MVAVAYRYSVALTYNGSTIFASTDSTAKTTITATVYDRGEPITTEFGDDAFNWIRSSAKPSDDTVWNNNHIGKGNQITIRHDDVVESSHFSCQVDLSKRKITT